MSLRLHFLVEGRTEFNFVNQVLKPYLVGFRTASITTSMLTTKRDYAVGRKFSGGASTYEKLSNEIKLFLRDSSSNFRLTTMIDLYGFPTGFPMFETLKKRPYNRVQQMEAKLSKDFGDDRFIPYVQLHEFEALLFSDPEKFAEIYSNFRKGIKELVAISTSKVPEEINDGENTAPSKRIIANIESYGFEKSYVGATVAQHIGLERIRERCSHFSEWVTKLEKA